MLAASVQRRHDLDYGGSALMKTVKVRVQLDGNRRKVSVSDPDTNTHTHTPSHTLSWRRTYVSNLSTLPLKMVPASAK